MPKLHILENRTYWIGASSSSEAVRVRELLALESFSRPMVLFPDGQVKLLHFWPVKLLQAGRADYEASAVRAMRAAASLRR